MADRTSEYDSALRHVDGVRSAPTRSGSRTLEVRAATQGTGSGFGRSGLDTCLCGESSWQDSQRGIDAPEFDATLATTNKRGDVARERCLRHDVGSYFGTGPVEHSLSASVHDE